jgi:CBS domain-containing protein
MNEVFPLKATRAAAAVWDVLLRLKVRDAMSRTVHCASRTDTFRSLKAIMKEKNISGMPIVEDGRLLGLVTINDIMNAIDIGTADEEVGKTMTRDLIVLEEDMPLTFAVSHLNKYPYRRYPVIDMDKRLIGVITSRRILAALVREMDKEIRELEAKIQEQASVVQNEYHNEFFIKRLDFENAGRASHAIKKVLKDRGLPVDIVRRASVAAYELEINIVVHSNGGKLTFHLTPDALTIQAIDEGPGIENVEDAVREGFSTANDWIRSLGFGAGMGLANTKRFSDDFKIESSPGGPTSVTCVINILPKTTEASIRPEDL